VSIGPPIRNKRIFHGFIREIEKILQGLYL
jgi:hypothetical protein